VYRGPTYVTVQIDEEISFKRWIDDVDVIEEADAESSTVPGFKEFFNVPADIIINKSMDEARSIDVQGHQDISDDDLKSIEKHIDGLEDEDVLHILDKERHDEAEEDWVPAGASLDEVLNASQRIKKRFDFLKTKSKREIAAQIARHRMSTPDRLKKKSITHARTLIMQRLLKGRDKSSLSPAEKDRIENIVSKSKAAVVRISNRLAQRIRQAEMARLRHVKEDFPIVGPDVGSYGETGNVSTTIDVDDSEHDERTRQNKKRLKGERDDVETHDKLNPALTRLKHFRKMET